MLRFRHSGAEPSEEPALGRREAPIRVARPGMTGRGLANAAPPYCLTSAWAPPVPFSFSRKGMERREAPGVCEAPHGAGHFLHDTDATLPERVLRVPVRTGLRGPSRGACGRGSKGGRDPDTDP